MGYRDLIASRLGGRFIASHIRIADGGPVPDNVHFHKVRLQLIYCYKGWVRVAYEDQGEAITMRAGDCVLQPPEIRHRVLEASDGMEVIEIACPAEHVTRLDHDMALPTGRMLPERDFGGQRFVFHVAAAAAWEPWRLRGFAARDTGIGAATGGLGGARVARVTGDPEAAVTSHDAEFAFNFVLDGAMTLTAEGKGSHALRAGDSFLVPAGLPHAFSGVSDDLQLLEVALPADFATTRHDGAVLSA
jgi:quercetin dioxygenase-like cupin family protein